MKFGSKHSGNAPIKCTVRLLDDTQLLDSEFQVRAQCVQDVSRGRRTVRKQPACVLPVQILRYVFLLISNRQRLPKGQLDVELDGRHISLFMHIIFQYLISLLVLCEIYLRR